MRARNKVIGALGAAVGLLLAVTTAIAPASAAQPSGGTITSTATSTCASFEGLTVTAPSVSYSGVGLAAGQSITVTVSPAAAGDRITLFTAVGFSWGFYEGPATQAYTFTAGASTVYSLQWAYYLANNSTSASTLNRTWTFDCSTASAAVAPPTTTADDDRDGVANAADSCSGTTLPDSVNRKVAGSYYANAAKSFVDGTGRAANITVADAGGCSAAQIAKAVGLSKSQSRSGVSLATLTSWANSH